MSTLDVLRAAREYISDPARWRQCGYYRKGAVCAVGAVNVAMGLAPDDDRVSAPEHLLNRLVDGSVAVFNDSHSHAEVLAVFDRAIAVEEAKAAEFDATPEPAPLVAA